jgi:hypothetical protein
MFKLSVAPDVNTISLGFLTFKNLATFFLVSAIFLLITAANAESLLCGLVEYLE